MRISVAPMLDYTDRHARYFYRLMSKKVWLYTEMVVAQALRGPSKSKLLSFSPEESPIVLQLGGSDAVWLSKAAQLGEQYGYDEINLNIGCPSDRVQSGRFGACLMKEPEQVAACLSAMQALVDIPITVKTRIGIDRDTGLERLDRLVNACQRVGCRRIIVHARNAWLKGLSPKANRTIPPLCYELVYELKARYPELYIEINGGIADLPTIKTQLDHVDGVMLGRAVTKNPYLLSEVDAFFGSPSPECTRERVVREYLPYIQLMLLEKVPIACLIKPILGIYQGMPGAKYWRQQLSSFGGNHHAVLSFLEKYLNSD